MFLLSISLFASAADCPQALSPDDLEDEVEEATLAWAAMDEDGFREAAARAEAVVPCLDEPVSPEQAANLHGLRALAAFLDGDTTTARTRLEAAHAADEGYAISTRLAPEGGPLWTLSVEASEADRDPGRPLSLLDGGTVWVDGTEGGRRSDQRPALVQVGADGRASWSALLEPGQAFEPPAPVLAELPDGGSDDVRIPRAPEAPARGAEGGGATALWAAAGGSGAVAAGLFGTSAYLRTRYDQQPSRGLHGATNGTFLASTGMAAVTGGLLTAALVKSSKRTSR